MSNDNPVSRLILNSERCQGHNRCHVIVPELISVDELGFAQVRGDGLIPQPLAGKARLAVRNCPEFALRVTRSTGEDTP